MKLAIILALFTGGFGGWWAQRIRWEFEKRAHRREALAVARERGILPADAVAILGDK